MPLRAVAIAACVLAGLLWLSGASRDSRPKVTILCAAGWRTALQPALRSLEAEYDVRTVYAGSGQLAGQIAAGQQADLFLAADAAYLDQLGKRVTARLPIRSQRAGLLLAPNVPTPTWSDLTEGRVTLSIARPKSAAISRVVQEAIGAEAFDRLRSHAKIERANVVEAANDAARLNVTDAALIWDTTAAAYPDCRFTMLPELTATGRVELGVLSDDASANVVAARVASLLRSRAE